MAAARAVLFVVSVASLIRNLPPVSEARQIIEAQVDMEQVWFLSHHPVKGPLTFYGIARYTESTSLYLRCVPLGLA
jgi:hypothetical protein